MICFLNKLCLCDIVFQTPRIVALSGTAFELIVVFVAFCCACVFRSYFAVCLLKAKTVPRQLLLVLISIDVIVIEASFYNNETITKDRRIICDSENTRSEKLTLISLLQFICRQYFIVEVSLTHDCLI